jgi:hypothetical protein
MLRTFAIVIAGAGIVASLPLTNTWACDDDRYPCPIRSQALIQETVQAADQPDQPQKKSAQPQKKAKPAPTNEKAQAKRDREAPRKPAGAKVSKPAVPEQTSGAVPQKTVEAASAAVASPRADQEPLNESRAERLLATAGTAWPVSPIAEGAAGTPPVTNINTADAASNAVQVVDPNEVNEIDRAASIESSSVNYVLWMLGAVLAAAFAMWLFSRMRVRFGRRTATAS